MSSVREDGVPTFAVSAPDIGGEAALELFRQATRDVFASELAGDIAPADYHMDMTAWHLGTLMVGSIRSSALTFERTGEIVAASGIDHVMVQLYTQGGFRGHADEHPITVEPGDICVFDMTRTLSTVASDFHNITLMTPRPFFEAAMDDVQSLHGIVLAHDNPLTSLLASYLVALAERLPLLRGREAEAAARGTVSLMTTVLADRGRSRCAGSPREIASPFRNIAMHIDRHLHEPRLEPDAIASAFGISRATLYRIFEPVGGVADYVRRRRLTGAALELASPAQRRKRVSEIAFAWGFVSEATFSRAFKAHFGISPTVARDEADRIWTAHSHNPTGIPPEREFAVWLKTLRN